MSHQIIIQCISEKDANDIFKSISGYKSISWFGETRESEIFTRTTKGERIVHVKKSKAHVINLML